MRTLLTCLLIFSLVLSAGSALAADAGPIAPKAAPKTPPKATPQAAPHANTQALSKRLGKSMSAPIHKGTNPSMKADAWYQDGAPRKARGSLWEQGVEGQSLTKDRTEQAKAKSLAEEARRQQAAKAGPPPAPRMQGAAGARGLDTQKGINSALDEISTYEVPAADGSTLGLNKPGGPSVQVTTDKSSWRNEASGPGTVGQDVLTTRRNVVGAYADVVNNDELRVSVGPELHIPDTETSSNHIIQQQPEASTLGVGMKWQWDF